MIVSPTAAAFWSEAGVTTADLTSDTVTIGLTVADAELFAELGSFSFAVTVAVLVIGAGNGFGALTVIVSVADAPRERAAGAHDAVP